MPRITKKTVTVLVAIVIALGGAGLAFAYWTTGGGGDGEAETGTSNNVGINQTTLLNEMGPGVIAQTLSGTFSNLGPATPRVSTVTVSIDSVDSASGTCAVADYVLTGAVMNVASTPIPVGPAVGAWGGATIAFANSLTEDQDDCQGATVNLTYVVN